MHLVSWIVIGLAAGWLAGKTPKGETYGPLMDVAIGIGGAIAAGFLMHSEGFNGFAGVVLTTLVAVMGAILLTLTVGVLNGRRMSAGRI